MARAMNPGGINNINRSMRALRMPPGILLVIPLRSAPPRAKIITHSGRTPAKTQPVRAGQSNLRTLTAIQPPSAVPTQIPSPVNKRMGMKINPSTVPRSLLLITAVSIRSYPLPLAVQLYLRRYSGNVEWTGHGSLPMVGATQKRAALCFARLNVSSLPLQDNCPRNDWHNYQSDQKHEN